MGKWSVSVIQDIILGLKLFLPIMMIKIKMMKKTNKTNPQGKMTENLRKLLDNQGIHSVLPIKSPIPIY